MRFASLAALLLFASGCAALGSARADREALQALTDPEAADVRNEYGWICEYSTVGFPPDQRQATFRLVGNRRVDLLREALHGSNLEGQIYAADALIYLSGEGVELTDTDRAAIGALRESEEEVETCGNSGSYKIYLVPAREVLSDSAVAEIPGLYRSAAEWGYFRHGS